MSRSSLVLDVDFPRVFLVQGLNMGIDLLLDSTCRREQGHDPVTKSNQQLR